jgi:hypothetical protein
MAELQQKSSFAIFVLFYTKVSAKSSADDARGRGYGRLYGYRDYGY